jgi:hypothetical protein
MPIQVQVPVVVGGASEMEEAVETLRLFGTRYKFNAPADVNLRAAELALYDPFRQWVVGNDVAVHVRALRGFVASGATDIHIQSLQRSPRRLIDFYGRFVLPLLARA